MVSSSGGFALAAVHGPGTEHFPSPLSSSAAQPPQGRLQPDEAHQTGGGPDAVPSSLQPDVGKRRLFSLFGRQQAFKLDGSGWSVADVALSGLPWLYDCSDASVSTPGEGGTQCALCRRRSAPPPRANPPPSPAPRLPLPTAGAGQQHPWEALWLNQAGAQSLLSLPCQHEQRVCGVLLLGSRHLSWEHRLLRRLGHLAYRLTPFAAQAGADAAALLHGAALRRFKSPTDIASSMLNELICLDKILVARITLQQQHKQARAATPAALPPKLAAPAGVVAASQAQHTIPAVRASAGGGVSQGNRWLDADALVLQHAAAHAAAVAAAAAGDSISLPDDSVTTAHGAARGSADAAALGEAPLTPRRRHTEQHEQQQHQRHARPDVPGGGSRPSAPHLPHPHLHHLAGGGMQQPAKCTPAAAPARVAWAPGEALHAAAPVAPPTPQDMLRRLQGSAAYVAARASLDDHLQQLAAYDERCRAAALALELAAPSGAQSLPPGAGTGAGLEELLIRAGYSHQHHQHHHSAPSGPAGPLPDPWLLAAAGGDATTAPAPVPWAPAAAAASASRVDRAALAADDFLLYMSAARPAPALGNALGRRCAAGQHEGGRGGSSLDLVDPVLVQQLLIRGLLSSSGAALDSRTEALPLAAMEQQQHGHHSEGPVPASSPLLPLDFMLSYAAPPAPAGASGGVSLSGGAGNREQRGKLSFSEPPLPPARSAASALALRQDSARSTQHDLFMSSLLSSGAHDSAGFFHRQVQQHLLTSAFLRHSVDSGVSGAPAPGPSPGNSQAHHSLASAASRNGAALTRRSSRASTQAPPSPLHPGAARRASVECHSFAAAAAPAAAPGARLAQQQQQQGLPNNRSAAPHHDVVLPSLHDPYLALAASSALYQRVSMGTAASAGEVGGVTAAARQGDGPVGAELGAAAISWSGVGAAARAAAAPSPPPLALGASLGAGGVGGGEQLGHAVGGAFGAFVAVQGPASAADRAAGAPAGAHSAVARHPPSSSAVALPSLPEEEREALHLCHSGLADS